MFVIKKKFQIDQSVVLYFPVAFGFCKMDVF